MKLMTDLPPAGETETTSLTERILSPAAQRALAEAQARRAQQAQAELAAEQDGPQGVEPTRFGDWERKGIAYDF